MQGAIQPTIDLLTSWKRGLDRASKSCKFVNEKCFEVPGNFLQQLAVSLSRPGVMFLSSFSNLPDLDARSRPLF